MRRSFGICVFIVLLVFPSLLAAQVLTVTPSNLQGWSLSASAPGLNEPPAAAYLAPGFETPPLGAGSVHFAVGQSGGDFAQARHAGYTGTRIDQLTALSYSTFTQVDGSGGQSPYLIIHIDGDGNLADSTDAELWFFEPLYQDATFFPSNPQGPLATDTWQTWDALAGGWYSTSGLAGSGPGTNVKSIADLLAAAPNATIRASGAGGVRIVTGFGAGAWDDFIGAADNFTIGTAGGTTTYDFEPVATTVITVTPSNQETWTLLTTNTNGGAFGASATFVTGPSPAPRGTGSVELAVGPDGDDSAQARSNRFDGARLRDLNELQYATYVQGGGSGGQAPYIILNVDYDNNGTTDDLLFFEPVYQTGAFCPSNPQPAIVVGAWQTWNAVEGCWWSVNGTAGATPGAGVKPLSVILAAEPDARLAVGAPGSLRVVAGFGAGAWDDFVGNFDALQVSVDPTRTLYDFDPDPIISIADVTQAEGNAGTTAFVFNVTLDKAASHTVTVNFSVADDTALVADGDYAAVAPGTITFVPGDTAETITVQVNGDLKFESDETFFVNLSAPSGATLPDAQAVGTITNDDPAPTIAIDDVTAPEGNSGTTPFTFTVTLSNPSSQTITVTAQTADGTATAPSDYTAAGPTVLTFVPGSTAQTFTVQVNGDVVFEPAETFVVNLTLPTNATIADGQGVGTITNDDPQPTISIGDVTLAEGNTGTTDFIFTVTLSGPSSEVVTVTAQTADDTATASSDYTAVGPTVLTFNPGVTTQTFTVPVSGDTAFEADETFFVNLTAPVNAAIADAQGVGTVTNDDTALADLSVIKTGPAIGDTATNISYMITVTNAGPQQASDVIVTDEVIAPTMFVSATPSQGTCTGTATVTCSLGPLATGASATITLVVRPIMPGTLSNTATVANTPEVDADPTNNTSTTTTVIGVAEIPTLSEWMLMLLAATLFGIALVKLR